MPDMLKSIDDLRQFDEAQARLQGHTLALTGTAARTDIVFHGQGNLADKATYKAEVMQYINTVCKKPERPDRSFDRGRRRIRADLLPRSKLLP